MARLDDDGHSGIRWNALVDEASAEVARLYGLPIENALLPTQHPTPFRDSPVDRLMLAVVFQAYADLAHKDPHRRMEARDYFERRRPQRLEPGQVRNFPFAVVCERFGWDQQWWCAQLNLLVVTASGEVASPRRVA